MIVWRTRLVLQKRWSGQKCEKRPGLVEVIDLYWGVKQEAKWEWEAGVLRVRGVVLRDYPVVVSVR